MFVVGFEVVCNLLPVAFLQGANLGRVGCGLISVAVDVSAAKDFVFEPTAVPVAVQDGVHAVVDDEIDDGLYGVEPAGVNGAVRGVAVPGAGNTHGVETCVLDGLYIGGVGEGIVPSCRASLVARHFHRVADVVAETHLGVDFGRLGEGERSRAGERERADRDTKLSDTKHFDSLYGMCGHDLPGCLFSMKLDSGTSKIKKNMFLRVFCGVEFSTGTLKEEYEWLYMPN